MSEHPTLPELNAAQLGAAKLWATDDRLWTTQETVEESLREFARLVLLRASSLAPVAPMKLRDPRFGWKGHDFDAEGPDGQCRRCMTLRREAARLDAIECEADAEVIKQALAPVAGASNLDGVALIAAERQRQRTKEGWTPVHDDTHDHGEMAISAARYALHDSRVSKRLMTSVDNAWPFESCAWKPKDPIRNLVRAGALVAAEIDRRQRLADRDRVAPPSGAQPANYERPPKVEVYTCHNCRKHADEQPCEHCGAQNGPPKPPCEFSPLPPATEPMRGIVFEQPKSTSILDKAGDARAVAVSHATNVDDADKDTPATEPEAIRALIAKWRAHASELRTRPISTSMSCAHMEMAAVRQRAVAGAYDSCAEQLDAFLVVRASSPPPSATEFGPRVCEWCNAPMPCVHHANRRRESPPTPVSPELVAILEAWKQQKSFVCGTALQRALVAASESLVPPSASGPSKEQETL